MKKNEEDKNTSDSTHEPKYLFVVHFQYYSAINKIYHCATVPSI